MAEKLVPPARFEHAAYGLGNRRSIRLSYGGIRWRITLVGWDDQAWESLNKLEACVGSFTITFAERR